MGGTLYLFPTSGPARSVLRLVGPSGTKLFDGVLEVVERFEVRVDGRESQVGDLVEVAERAENDATDIVRVDVGGSRRAHGLFHLARKNGEVIAGDRPSLAGLPHPGYDLFAGEGFRRAGAFDDDEGRRLSGREPAFARGTFPPAPDRLPVIERTGVDDSGISVVAERTVHPFTLH